MNGHSIVDSAVQSVGQEFTQRFNRTAAASDVGANGGHAMALTMCEFAAAACHYPIVFAGESALPMAVLGWREGQNLFVDAAGEWRRDVYVPAGARRAQARVEACERAETLDFRLEETRHFGLWLEANRMLEPQSIRAELRDGSAYLLRGFKLVNPGRVLGLTDAQVVELHRRGWLTLLHLHLQSLENWQRLGGPARVSYQYAEPRP